MTNKASALFVNVFILSRDQEVSFAAFRSKFSRNSGLTSSVGVQVGEWSWTVIDIVIVPLHNRLGGGAGYGVEYGVECWAD